MPLHLRIADIAEGGIIEKLFKELSNLIVAAIKTKKYRYNALTLKTFQLVNSGP